MSREERCVLAAVDEPREFHPPDEPSEHVVLEQLGVAVRRGHEAERGAAREDVTEALVLPGVEDAQQVRLELE